MLSLGFIEHASVSCGPSVSSYQVTSIVFVYAAYICKTCWDEEAIILYMYFWCIRRLAISNFLFLDNAAIVPYSVRYLPAWCLVCQELKCCFLRLGWPEMWAVYWLSSLNHRVFVILSYICICELFICQLYISPVQLGGGCIEYVNWLDHKVSSCPKL